MTLREFSLTYLGKNAVSGITRKALDTRYNQIPDIDLQAATVSKSKKHLDLRFNVFSTFLEGESIPKGYTNSPKGQYTVDIRLENIPSEKFANWFQMQPRQKNQLINSILTSCDAKVYSDDPSFYEQGFWEDLEKSGMSLYKFPGPRGAGVWQARHKASGGLANPNVRVSKHIAQICENIISYTNDIVNLLSQNGKIQESVKLQEDTMDDLFSIDEFFQAVGFVPPSGKQVSYFVSPVELDRPVDGFEASEPAESGLSITYKRKDPATKVSAAPTPAEYNDFSMPEDIPVQAPLTTAAGKTYTEIDTKCPFLDEIGLGTYILNKPYSEFSKNTIFQFD